MSKKKKPKPKPCDWEFYLDHHDKYGRKPWYFLDRKKGKKDKRIKTYKKQLRRWGFCDCETWNLYDVIAAFALPRLKRFKELNIAYPGNGISWRDWNKMLKKMIWSFEYVLRSDKIDYTKKDGSRNEKKAAKDWRKFQEGMHLFAEHFMHLWW